MNTNEMNEMVAQIHARDAALRQANAALEKHVSERTRDLQVEIAERREAQAALMRLHAELEKAYEDLRQTRQTVMQQDRLKALGQMASGIAHDINNALSPVVGFADLLARSEPGMSENGRKYLQHIKTAGEDIAHIVNRLREFYRRRGEKQPLLPFHLNTLVEQVIAMTRPRWRDMPQERGVTVEMLTEFEGSLPPLVGTESEVRDALTNLVLNAADALPFGGKISIRTGIARRGAGSEGTPAATHLLIEVSDTGIGMDAQTREHCLEPFYSNKGGRGTGLGLSMVYGVMERHEGRIEIESELGKGTTMRLIFPVRAVKSEGAPPLESVPCPHPLHVLCIDDEPLLRELLKEMLERDGHQVCVADGGHAGVETYRAALRAGKAFDLVITDLGMPYLDGRQVAALIRQESAETPIILLTGWGAFMKDSGEHLQQVDAVISKPPRDRELRQTILRLTEKHMNGSASAPQ